MAVTCVVHADALHARRLASALHLVGQEVPGHSEQALVGGSIVAHTHVPEERHEPVVDDLLLGDPGVLAYARRLSS